MLNLGVVSVVIVFLGGGKEEFLTLRDLSIELMFFAVFMCPGWQVIKFFVGVGTVIRGGVIVGVHCVREVINK